MSKLINNISLSAIIIWVLTESLPFIYVWTMDTSSDIYDNNIGKKYIRAAIVSIGYVTENTCNGSLWTLYYANNLQSRYDAIIQIAKRVLHERWLMATKEK